MVAWSNKVFSWLGREPQLRITSTPISILDKDTVCLFALDSKNFIGSAVFIGEVVANFLPGFVNAVAGRVERFYCNISGQVFSESDKRSIGEAVSRIVERSQHNTAAIVVNFDPTPTTVVSQAKVKDLENAGGSSEQPAASSASL